MVKEDTGNTYKACKSKPKIVHCHRPLCFRHIYENCKEEFESMKTNNTGNKKKQDVKYEINPYVNEHVNETANAHRRRSTKPFAKKRRKKQEKKTSNLKI